MDPQALNSPTPSEFNMSAPGGFDELLNTLTRLVELMRRREAKLSEIVQRNARFVEVVKKFSEIEGLFQSRIEDIKKRGVADLDEILRDLIEAYEEMMKVEADLISVLDELVEIYNEDYNLSKEIVDMMRRIRASLHQPG